MRIQLILPKIDPNKIIPPTTCPYPDCEGDSFHLRQTISRPLRDIIHRQVNVYRYSCFQCNRSFTIYPEGVSRKLTSHRVKSLAIILYLLGLSCSAVSTILKALGISGSKSQMYYDVRAAAVQSAGLKRENILEGIRIPAQNEAAADVKWKGQWKPLKLRIDSQGRLTVSIDHLYDEDAQNLKDRITSIVEHFGGQLLVKENTEPFNKVIKDTEHEAPGRTGIGGESSSLMDWQSVNLDHYEVLKHPVEAYKQLSDQPSSIYGRISYYRLLSNPANLWKYIHRSGITPVRVSLLYMFAIVLAEVVTLLLAPQLGLAFHGLLLVALLVHAGFTPLEGHGRLMLALAFVPLIRLISFSMPLNRFSPLFNYVAIGIPLAVSAFLAARTMKMSAFNLGLNGQWLPLQVLFAFFGIGLGYLEYRILQPNPLIAELRLEQIWLPALILLAVTGLLEEFIFRGLMQTAAVQVLGRWGIIYVSALFAVMHLGYQSAPEFLFIFAVGLFFGFFKLVTNSVLGVALAHGLANITLYLIFPFTLRMPL